jgi:glycine/D-amino acid oxidase-like deaminating enzyme
MRNAVASPAMNLKESNYWLQTVSIPASDPLQLLPEAADVAVVGAGFTGLSAALALAKRGVSVVVLEAETFGWGASSRNGGMVLAGLKLPVPTLVSRYGREATRRMYLAGLASIESVADIVREENLECDFFRSGHLEVACKQAHFAVYEETARIAREFNHTVEIVPKSELRREIGSDIYYGAMVDPVSAGLNPARYVAGLAVAAKRAGAALFEHAGVTGVQAENANGTRRFRVQTSRGSLSVREVVLASGAYTTKATPVLQKKIIPIGSYIIATEVLPEDLAREGSPRNRMIFDSKNFLYYYRLTPDRRMLFGGRAAFFPATESTVRESAEILRRGMVQVFPQLRDTKVEYVWGGTLDFTLDVMPHTGKLDGMYYAIGYAGNGVATGTYFGTKIAGLICGETNDLPFDGIAFRNAPFGLRSGHTWALPLAGAYYRVLDLIS